MDRAAWRKELGEVVREALRSPELKRYFDVRMTKRRAQLMLAQLGIYIRHRRDCWANVSSNCPVLAVKQKILQHEFGEVIKDEYTEHGHMDLFVRKERPLVLAHGRSSRSSRCPLPPRRFTPGAGSRGKRAGSKGSPR